VLGRLESSFNIHPLAVRGLEASLHDLSVGNDVDSPLLEVAYLILCLADDDLDDCAVHPVGLSYQPVPLGEAGRALVLRRRCGGFALLGCDGLSEVRGVCLPPRYDTVVHPRARDFVDADQHRLAGLPSGCKMLYKVVSDPV
jgi:hypothetical protein